MSPNLDVGAADISIENYAVGSTVLILIVLLPYAEGNRKIRLQWHRGSTRFTQYSCSAQPELLKDMYMDATCMEHSAVSPPCLVVARDYFFAIHIDWILVWHSGFDSQPTVNAANYNTVNGSAVHSARPLVRSRCCVMKTVMEINDSLATTRKL